MIGKSNLYVLWTNSDMLEQLGIEVKYWGEPLTGLLKGDEALLTV